MAEYIDRERLTMGVLGLAIVDSMVAQYADAVLFQIRQAPAADVAPVVHGRWREADDGDGAVCSICGEDFCNIYLEVDRFKYCPNCGARMDGA